MRGWGERDRESRRKTESELFWCVHNPVAFTVLASHFFQINFLSKTKKKA